jgi:hypothetical protein
MILHLLRNEHNSLVIICRTLNTPFDICVYHILGVHLYCDVPYKLLRSYRNHSSVRLFVFSPPPKSYRRRKNIALHKPLQLLCSLSLPFFVFLIYIYVFLNLDCFVFNECIRFRLFSQIRKRAPLHDEWHEAFATGRFHQRQGRATLEAAAPLPSGLRKIATLPLGAEQQSLPSNLSGSKRYRNSSGGEKRRAADSSSSEDGSADVPPEERSTSDTAFALLELCGTSGGLPPAKPPKTSSHSRRRVEKDSGGGEPAPRAESAAALPPPSADRPLRSEVEQQLWQEQLQLQANVQEHLLQMQHQMQMLQSVGLNSGNSPAWPTAAAHQHPEEFGYHAGYLPQNNNFAPYTDSAANEM